MNNSPDTLSATLSDAFEVPSWNRQRSVAELRAFVLGREEALDVADFDL